MESPSDRGCIGTMPPAFANTGIPSSGRQTVMRRPLGEDALYRRPVKKSNQSPCGSHTSALPRREDLSIGSVMGAASSSVPNMYSLGTGGADVFLDGQAASPRLLRYCTGLIQSSDFLILVSL